MKKTLYISIAKTSEPIEIEKVKQKLRDMGVEFSFYEQGTKYDISIVEKDCVIVIPPANTTINNDAENGIHSFKVGKGQHGEILHALDKNVPVYATFIQIVDVIDPILSTIKGITMVDPKDYQYGAKVDISMIVMYYADILSTI